MADAAPGFDNYWNEYPADEWSDAIVAAMKLGGVDRIFFVSGSESAFLQEATAKAYIAQLDAAHIFPAPIVTKVEPLKAFYPAEDYHQDYFENNPFQPYCQGAVAPKVAKVRKVFKDLLKE